MKPIAIIAQVDGSGTEGVTGEVTTVNVTPSAGSPSSLVGVKK
jgi:hypothetical protein